MFKFALPVALLALLAVIVPDVQAGSASPPRMVPYEIAQQGLPTTIAGYKVLTVLTSGTTACMPPGEKHLILQARQPNVKTSTRSQPYAYSRFYHRMVLPHR